MMQIYDNLYLRVICLADGEYYVRTSIRLQDKGLTLQARRETLVEAVSDIEEQCEAMLEELQAVCTNGVPQALKDLL